jgi:hypothetical protein
MRKPIQIAHAMSDERGYSIVALCNDGTIWEIDAQYRTWERTLDIPQDPDTVDMNSISSYISNNKCEKLKFNSLDRQAIEINSDLDAENERLNWKVEVAREALLKITQTNTVYAIAIAKEALEQIK